MKTAKIVIVEDEPIIAADLERQLTKIGHEIVASTDNGRSAINLSQTLQPDIILMDIQLDGDLDGIDTAHEINKYCEAPIIFLTSNTDDRTFRRARLTQPYAFLSKPFRTKDIEHSISLALEEVELEISTLDEENISSLLADRIFVRNKFSLQKIMLKDIVFVEAQGAYCKIHTSDKNYMISSTLKKLASNVSYNKLVRVHRSYLINIDFVDQISEGHVQLGNDTVPVGRVYKELLSKYFKSL